MNKFKVIVSGNAVIRVDAKDLDEAKQKIEEVLDGSDKGLEIEKQLDKEELLVIKNLSDYEVDWATDGSDY